MFYNFKKGIRSDSDMYSYSFSWKVWKSTKIIASGEEIKNYLTTAVEEEGKSCNCIQSCHDYYICISLPVVYIGIFNISLYKFQFSYTVIGIMKNIIFNTNIESAEWISSKNCWHLVTSSGKKFSCNVLFGCTGYYSYENPYEPTFPGGY